MATESKQKAEPKEKKAKAPAKTSPEALTEGQADAPAVAAPKAPSPPPAPRPPADARLKLLKKLQRGFLPKGALRDRYHTLMVRWESGADRGGVAVGELRSLVDDWKRTREKTHRPPKT